MDKKLVLEKIPQSHRQDIQTAIDILNKEGCKEIYLFGSLANGQCSDRSDIDLAVNGLNKRNFFKILGKLLLALEHPVDLVNLEKMDKFSIMLKRKGVLVRVS
jgi:predicted nucleotidyltransferase